MTDLGTLGGTDSYANSINASGTMVGTSYITGNSVQHAFISSVGAILDLNNLIPEGTGWVLQDARGINDNGWIVGYGTIAGQTVSVSNQSAATFMYVGGVDAGLELYAVSRLYVSASLGWAHPVYTSPDMAAMQSNPSAGMQFKQVAADTFTFKVGIGL